jgi:hypothetical protein
VVWNLTLRGKGTNREGAKYAKEEEKKISLKIGLPVKINVADY